MGAIRLRIDGTMHDVVAGTTVLDAARAAGIHLPALCHDDRLEPTGACRSCLVRVAGVPKPVPACTTMACEGMEIQTATDELLDARRTVLQMLARHYPQTALDRSPDHPFHAELRTAGLMQEAAGPACAAKSADHSHPYIAVDMTRCIDC
ncbi:MAG: 2Fe-2S iron-sulfur cluster-binding protein, partial [Vicinamibacterales bacterium]